MVRIACVKPVHACNIYPPESDGSMFLDEELIGIINLTTNKFEYSAGESVATVWNGKCFTLRTRSNVVINTCRISTL